MENNNTINVTMDKDYYAQVMSGGGSGGGTEFAEINTSGTYETIETSAYAFIFTLNDEIDILNINAPTKLNISAEIDSNITTMPFYILYIKGGAFSGYTKGDIEVPIAGVFTSKTTLKVYIIM